MGEFLKFEVWPWVKVKLTYYWWIIRYGGKKNIPPELIFKKMEETAASLTEDVKNAIRVSPLDKMSEEERLQARELLMKVAQFEEEIKDLKKQK